MKDERYCQNDITYKTSANLPKPGLLYHVSEYKQNDKKLKMKGKKYQYKTVKEFDSICSKLIKTDTINHYY